VPYRANYGQSLSIVGSTPDLGAWDISTRVPMEWSDGDVWRAKVVADDGDLEYKYVVVEADGQVSRWKPGGNFKVVLEGFSGTVHIEDTWDGSEHNVVTTSDSAEVAPAATPADSYDEVLREALRHAFGELEETLTASQALAESSDPDDPELLMIDQKLLAATQRATSLSKAVSAGAPPPAYILREIEVEAERRASESASDGIDESAQ
jgi:Starch binding domain